MTNGPRMKFDEQKFDEFTVVFIGNGQIIFQKAQSPISTVFGQFSYLSSFSQYMHPPGEETKSHIDSPLRPFS